MAAAALEATVAPAAPETDSPQFSPFARFAAMSTAAPAPGRTRPAIFVTGARPIRLTHETRGKSRAARERIAVSDDVPRMRPSVDARAADAWADATNASAALKAQDSLPTRSLGRYRGSGR